MKGWGGVGWEGSGGGWEGSEGWSGNIVRGGMGRYHILQRFSLLNPCSLKMEVGIEDCLHIEFEYNKAK